MKYNYTDAIEKGTMSLDDIVDVITKDNRKSNEKMHSVPLAQPKSIGTWPVRSARKATSKR